MNELSNSSRKMVSARSVSVTANQPRSWSRCSRQRGDRAATHLNLERAERAKEDGLQQLGQQQRLEDGLVPQDLPRQLSAPGLDAP